mmetsp:Transcript_40034/g.58895  ORF Transcript_40034/g.58895 Transcript_40034/m.58895 type:complete len:330 (-) Transcript_40034:368-1357(-)
MMEILLNDDDENINEVSVVLPNVDVTLHMVSFLEESEHFPVVIDEEETANEEDEDDEEDGTNSVVWPAGVKMARLLASPTAKVLLQGKKNVLEMGSGCGISGMGLIAALARSEDPMKTKVTLTDFPSALPLLEANFEENQEAILAESGISANVAKLAWGNEEHIKDLGDDKFDLIIGSDLLYKPSEKIIKALSSTINTVLDPENGLIILAIRWREPDQERIFFQDMEKLGYEFVLVEEHINELGGVTDVEEKKDEDFPMECKLSWQDFGNEKSEKSKKFFSETTFKVNGETKSLSEISESHKLDMDDKDFDGCESIHTQIYAGYKQTSS